MIRRPPRSPLFPHPTLSRSAQLQSPRTPAPRPSPPLGPTVSLSGKMRRRREAVRIATWNVNGLRARLDFLVLWLRERRPRSEEHTSELQSQSNLVCRLLLEKKKKTT